MFVRHYCSRCFFSDKEYVLYSKGKCLKKKKETNKH